MLVHGIVYLQREAGIVYLQREAGWAGCWLLWSVMRTSGCRMKACRSWRGGGQRGHNTNAWVSGPTDKDL